MPIPQEKKEELFEAVTPQRQGPMLISRSVKKSAFGSLGALFLVLFLMVAGALGYVYWKYDWVEKGTVVAGPAESTSGSVLERVSRHLLLPSGQTPTVSEDASGNAVLAYPTFQVVYNPERDIIVEVRPATFAAAVIPTSTPASEQVAGAEVQSPDAAKPTGPITVDIRNGSGIAGHAGRTRDSLKELAGYEVAAVGNAAKNNHEVTLVVNRTGRNIEALEQKLGVIAITSLPGEEAQSSADVVIILGRK